MTTYCYVQLWRGPWRWVFSSGSPGCARNLSCPPRGWERSSSCWGTTTPPGEELSRPSQNHVGVPCLPSVWRVHARKCVCAHEKCESRQLARRTQGCQINSAYLWDMAVREDPFQGAVSGRSKRYQTLCNVSVHFCLWLDARGQDQHLVMKITHNFPATPTRLMWSLATPTEQLSDL